MHGHKIGVGILQIISIILRKESKELNKYIDNNIEDNKAFNKPMVLEEFGLARDENSYEPSSPVTIRDAYYNEVIGHVYEKTKEGMM